VPNTDDSQTSIAFQQERDAHLAFVKPASKRSRVQAFRPREDDYSRETLGQSAVDASSSHWQAQTPVPNTAALSIVLQPPLRLDEADAAAAKSVVEGGSGAVADLAAEIDNLPSPVRSRAFPATENWSQERLRGLRSLEADVGLNPQSSLLDDRSSASELADGAQPQLPTAWFSSNLSEIVGSRHAGSVHEDSPQQPALYAVIAAIAASIGYMGLVAVRCIGLLQELAPHKPTSDFIRPPCKPLREDVPADGQAAMISRSRKEARRETRRATPAARLCCPTREPLRSAPPSMQIAQVPSFSETSPL
jgi:hypothetical protein